MGEAYLTRRGGGGATLAPLTNPAFASDIVNGKEAYSAAGEVIIGAYVVSDVHPQLNAVSIAKSNNNLNIINPSTNGNFVDGYKVMSGGEEVTRVESTTLVLTELNHAQYVFTVKAHGEGFNDSADSNALTITVYAFINGLKDVTSDFDFEKTTSGMTASFSIVADAGFHLPASIQIKCNGEDVDFTYNPYTGEVAISALETAYSGTVVDGGQLVTPTIEGVEGDTMSVRDVAFAEEYQVNEGATSYGDVELTAGGAIGIAAQGLVTPKLMSPSIALSGDDALSVVDGYLLEGDVFYSDTYDLYVDDVLESADIDSTTDQNVIITWTKNNGQFVLQSDGSYQTAKSSSYNNSFAYVRVMILAPAATQIKVDYTIYPYNTYIRCYLGKLDQAFTKSVSVVPSSSQYQVASSGTSTVTSSYTLDVPAGAHFIDFIKQYNTTSTSSTYYNRYLKVAVSEV